MLLFHFVPILLISNQYFLISRISPLMATLNLIAIKMLSIYLYKAHMLKLSQ
jgi:hypothetical protein